MDSCVKRCKKSCGLGTVISILWPIIEFFLPITVTFALLWLLLRPGHVRPGIDAAALIKFSLTPNNSGDSTSTLDYEIAIDLSFHNPHKHLDARYLGLTAVASCAGTRLGPTVDVLPVFVQRPRETNVFHAVFQGSAARLAPAAAQVLRTEVAGGSVNVLVTITSTFMYKVLFEKPVYYYEHKCYLSLQTPHQRSPAAAAMLNMGTVCSSAAR